MPAVQKSKKQTLRFVVDCSAPVADQIFDTAAFEKYLNDRIKVKDVKISREAETLVFVTNSLMSKRYLKYLTKKYLKKHQLRDWLRVIASDKETYVIKYFQVGDEDKEDDE